MIQRIMTIAAVLMIGAVSRATDTPSGEPAVKNALAQKWTDLTISEMIDQGCVAPIYIGLRITRTTKGLSIARWQNDQRGERLGPFREFEPALLPKFIDGVLKHYAAACASEDIHEKIAKLKSEEEREKAWAAAIKAAGGLRIGGFGAMGIDVRISIDGAQKRFEDHYGRDGFEDLEKWLSQQGAEYQH